MYTTDVYDTMLLRVFGLTENGVNWRFWILNSAKWLTYDVLVLFLLNIHYTFAE